MGNTAKQCRLGLFQDSDFAGDLEDSNLHQVEHCAFLEAIRLFQSVGCVRNKLLFRTVQQNQKIISLDAGLRLDGIPALDLLDLIFAVLHGNTSQSNQERGDPCTKPGSCSTSQTSNAKEISWND